MAIFSGGNGKDVITGTSGNDVIDGGNGGDILDGAGGADIIYGRNGDDQLIGGDGDDVLDGNLGFDVAYYRGLIEEYTFLATAGYLHIIHQGGAGVDGHDQVTRIERLVFADRTINIGSGHNVPVAVDDHVAINEETGNYRSGAASVLDNDYDFDGDPLTVSAGTLVGSYGTLTLNSNGTYSYAVAAAGQALAQGQIVDDSFNYTVTDNDGSDTGKLIFHIAGANDAPTANPDTIGIGENDVALVNVLANDSDIDNGAVLTVTAASAPAGQGSASVVDNQVQFDPGSDFDHLADGDSAQVVVSYDMADEHGATDSSTLTVTVTGINDAPVANPDSAATGENGSPFLIDVLANDTDVDDGATVTLTAASAPAGQGSASVAGSQVQFDPGGDFDDLAAGQTELVQVSYSIEDEHGASSSSTVDITVTGANDAPVANPDTRTSHENEIVTVDVLANDTDVDNGAVLTITAASVTPGEGSVTIVDNKIRYNPGNDLDYLADGESHDVVINYTIKDEHGVQSQSTLTITVQGETDGTLNGTDNGETLTGTPDDDRIFARGGDDTVFGLAGNDFIGGGDGADTLNGEAGNDAIQGGDDNDVISGGDGFDQLNGEAGDDTITGGIDGDNLAGGEGDDTLSGEAGNDFVFGEAGEDDLSGGDGDDFLNGGGDDDSLDGGDGADVLNGGLGSNVLNGGLGDDEIVADSTEGAQTVDGAAGNDSIRHYYRSSASTITTGTGSDTIELVYADQGNSAITVTDFTPGAGGDIMRLEGGEGSLLSLLVGWDGSSNPFGSSFLRLQQSGSNTVLQWDRDGSGTDSDWETLIVFQNTTATSFTGANFDPAYPPDGSPPAGQTITGTDASQTIVGTLGDDTINAMGGNDNVFGRAGSDTINGGDGFDFLNGEAGNDIIDGGNGDDNMMGGDGNDTMVGQAGSDVLSGDAGDDDLSGGDGSDNLNGGLGDDVVAGGNDGDVLSGGEGDDSLSGGGGDDFLTDTIGVNSFDGGSGDDAIYAGSADGVQTVNGGDGNDSIRHYDRYNASTITTGAGSDTIELARANQGNAVITVTDFTTGGGGDRIRLDGYDASLLSLLQGWDGSSNPFGSGFLRLQQSGSDTVLQWDRDGAGTDSGWETLILFTNTTAGDFTEANFEPAFAPGGAPPAGETINGTAGDDILVGGIGPDTINALAGEDSVFGQAGDDLIYGGDGLDNLNGGDDDDHVEGGNGDDNVSGGEGDDVLLGQAGNDILFGENGDDDLSGGDGADNLSGEAGNDVISGGNDDDFLSGGDGNDNVNGGAGGDILSGADGADVLTGGLGADIFDFQSAAQGADEITDFVSGTDHIQISASGFGGGLSEGDRVSIVSGSNPTATGTTGQFLYDTDDGHLFWDPDGAGSEAAVLIATLDGAPPLQPTDIFVAA